MTAIITGTDSAHCWENAAGVPLHQHKSFIMEIYISEDATIASIQCRFREAYPFLKLECYQQPHETGEGSPPEEKFTPETPIEDIRMMHTFGWIDIGKHRTATELERDFKHIFGLSVQVLRKSGDLWLETTKTDNWTLEQLNEEGKLAEAHIFYYPDEPAE
jgi:hypothetical protein